MSQRISAGEIVTDERLVHEDQGCAAHDLALLPGAAADQGNLQGREVFRADGLEMHLLRLGGRLAQDFDRNGPTAIGRSGIGRYSSPNHTGHLSDFLTQLLKKLGAVGPRRVRIFANRNHDRHHMFRLIPELHGVHVKECLNSSASRRHKQQSQRDLSRNEGGVEASALHAARQPACPGLHHLADLWPRRLQGRKETEDDSDQNCQAYTEKQDSKIDVEVGFIWVGVVRQARDDEPNALVGNKDAQSRSSHR